MQNMSPEDMARMKDMMAALNGMIEAREQGEDPQFEKFMEQFGDFFPENPQTLDELLENMAKRMQAMQALMDSLTPEQRSQMQQLSEQLMEDMDLNWQVQQLSEKLQSMFPQPGQGEGQGYNFRGEPSMDMQQAMDAMQEMGELNEMEGMLRQATNPAQLAEVDIDKVREMLGEDAAKSMERLAEMTKMLEEAGLINLKEGKMELTPDCEPLATTPFVSCSTTWQKTSSVSIALRATAVATSAPMTRSHTNLVTRSALICSAQSVTPSHVTAVARR